MLFINQNKIKPILGIFSVNKISFLLGAMEQLLGSQNCPNPRDLQIPQRRKHLTS